MTFIYFSCLNSLTRTSSIILNKVMKQGVLALFLITGGGLSILKQLLFSKVSISPPFIGNPSKAIGHPLLLFDPTHTRNYVSSGLQGLKTCAFRQEAESGVGNIQILFAISIHLIGNKGYVKPLNYQFCLVVS